LEAGAINISIDGKPHVGGEEFIKMGMTSDWKDEGSLIRLHLLYASKHEYQLDAQKQAALKELVPEELKKGVIRAISHKPLRMYNPIFPVLKSDGHRKVTDCRHLNEEQRTYTSNERARTADPSSGKSGLCHFAGLEISIQPPDCQRGFSTIAVPCFPRNIIRISAVPLGAKHVPRLFTKAFSYPMAFIRRHRKIRILMDDSLILHPDRQYLAVATLQIAIYLQRLSWTINLEKSELTPLWTVDFLGWRWDFDSLSIRSNKNRRHSFLDMLKQWIPAAYNGSIVQSGSFAFLIGVLSLLWLYVHALHSNLNQSVQANEWDSLVTLNKNIVSELLWYYLEHPVRFRVQTINGCFDNRHSDKGRAHFGDDQYHSGQPQSLGSNGRLRAETGTPFTWCTSPRSRAVSRLLYKPTER
jgi:hypothetical protein